MDLQTSLRVSRVHQRKPAVIVDGVSLRHAQDRALWTKRKSLKEASLWGGTACVALFKAQRTTRFNTQQACMVRMVPLWGLGGEAEGGG